MPLPFILAGVAVAAAGYGAKKGYDGYQKKSEANEISEDAEREYNRYKAAFDSTNEKTEKSLETLGELQLQIGQDFTEFRKIADALLKQLNESKVNKDLKVDLPEHRLNKIADLSISAAAYLGQLAGAGAAGAAAAYAVYGGVMALAAASTGTPIAALSGIAAHNAAMAAIGGGAIGAGGFGMAGGAMVLGGVVAAPIIAIAGFAFDNYAEKALEEAKKYRRKVDEAVHKLEIGTKQLVKVISTVNTIHSSISSIYEVFQSYFEDLKAMDAFIRNKGNIEQVGDTVMMIINNGYQIAAILTDIITTPLFKLKKVNGEVVVNEDKSVEFETDSEGMQVLNTEEIDGVLLVAKHSIKPFENKN